MAFIKYSQLQRLAYWEGDGKVHKTAAMEKTASFFADPANTVKLNVGEMLAKVAKEYDISSDPKNYLFEAVRAVTSGVANENGDAFSKDELLRFDHRVGKPVYQTFILKPHHVNHRADNPKTARGVMLDAHYNDSTPPLEVCPREGCGNRTAAREGRDRTGLYCRKCGFTVKDEFVEILIGVDKSKDPAFAEGVRTGALNATSMGCVCDSTTCNVCEHVAYNRNEFCTHIRSGNKKKMFQTASGEKQAFEWCNDVTFTEHSRVDQPADPKALQQEILSLVAQRDEVAGDMKRETELLLLNAQINELQRKVAQLDPSAPPTAMPTSQLPAADPVNAKPPPEPGSIAEFVQNQEQKVDASGPMTQEEMGIKDNPGPEVTGMGVSGSIDQSIIDEFDALAARYANVSQNKGATMSFKFKSSYINLRAAVTENGNCRIYTADGDTLFVAKPIQPITAKTAAEQKDARVAFATDVLRHIATHGLVPTMKAYEVVKSPKIAQVLEKAIVDFTPSERPKGDTKGHPEGGSKDFTDARATPADSPVKTQVTDMDGDQRSKKDLGDSALDSHVEDMEEKRNSKGEIVSGESVLDEEDSDMKSKRSKPAKSPIDGIMTDHQEKVAQMAPPFEGGSKSKGSKSKPSASKPSASKPSASKPSASKPSASKSSSRSSSKSSSRSSSKPPVPSKEGMGAYGEGEPAMPPATGAPMGDAGAAGAPMPTPGGPMTGAEPDPEMRLKSLVDKISQCPDPTLQAAMMDDVVALSEHFAPVGAPADGGMPMAAAKKEGKEMPSFIKRKIEERKGGSKGSKGSAGSKSASKGSKEAVVSKTAAAEKVAALESRLERLYKGRFAKLKEDADARVASADEAVAARFLRAFKLAASRQYLGLEESPIKVAFADSLMSPMELGNDEMFPGIDPELTVNLIERAAAVGYQEFVEKTVARAAELAKLSEEAFDSLEADVKNLQPVAPQVVVASEVTENANQKRQAARQGNMHLASAGSEDEKPAGGRIDRSALRASLGSTKVGTHTNRLGVR